MRRPRLALLDASHGDENVPRNYRRELSASLAEFDVTAGSLPTDYDVDGVVVTGSRSSVYWDEDWIEATKAWVEGAIDRGVPCLGVCWGHQLLADVLGGEVADMGVYEIGYHEIDRTTDESVLLAGIDETFLAFTTHSDAVVDLPPKAIELARNEYSNHAFRRDRVFGVQFHPEYDAQSARDLTMEKELDDDRRERVLAGITDENARRAAGAKQLFENFVAYVEGGAGVSDATDGAERVDAD
ncbi:GMP synthase family protein [Halovivax ruber XH-70]|uniref:GMP synthase family protein n=1 Tax=Halovivax ruber (strain DSM 18193 / JCM 13892 / XH-70) TaxID=797302 RepID=L0IEA0_HALRX|nr:type 1 glutamine amidotransferase [Halovivax ruber]AGB17099.1 GMP synthase family protein [Halovivax ruber XH-70]